jgi:arginine decarboxylase
MSNKFKDLIEGSYQFPQEGFELDNNDNLLFYDVPIKDLIDKYGTPFKLYYLPKVSDQIDQARDFFSRAFSEHSYGGSYHYCYCTKSSHFSYVIKKVLSSEVHLETSSAFDINIIKALYQSGEVNTSLKVIHNGYKNHNYLLKIIELSTLGFSNLVLVLDSIEELTRLKQILKHRKIDTIKIGIRVAIDEAPQSPYYTSRLGIRASKILDFYRDEIHGDSRFSFEMLHFYIDTGIQDNLYYWDEFQKMLSLYVSLKRLSTSLHCFNIGGGLPIRNQLRFDYDYGHIISEIVRKIKLTCEEAKIGHPDIYSEFGRYSVGESGAIIFEVLEQKKQNEKEIWYIIDNSLMNTLPDSWSIKEKFVLLPINKWQNDYTRVNIGGMSCDHSDFYNSEQLNQQILLPQYCQDETEPLYLGFFHTGAYQDAISGYGGIKHCLIPAPRIIVLDHDEEGRLTDRLYRDEQSPDEMLSLLGYNESDGEL